MRKLLAAACFLFMGVLVAPAVAGASVNPNGSGQPNQSCQDVVASGGTEPGRSAGSPGSPFNEPSPTSAGGTGGAAYSAGNANSPNAKAVSQYDVACYQVSR
jgi:hypothetical protein